MNYLIGTDIGTSGTKTVLMDTQGNLIAEDTQEYDVLTPQPLWAEQWPDVWEKGVRDSIRNTVKKAKVDVALVKGICISGLYGGSGIPLDADMKPIRPCLIWMDRRASKECDWVRENVGEEKLRRITQNGIDPYYGYTKMLWIKHNEPQNWAKTKLLLPPNDYVIYKLTGEVAIDYSSAGNIGGIFDMNTRTWSDELLKDMGIDKDKLPQKIVESTDIVGKLTKEAAADLGLAEGTPICAGGIDCGAANIGMGVLEPGTYAVTIGTSMCAALISDKPISGTDLIIWPYLYDAKRLSYNFAGSITAGAVVKWFRNTFAELELDKEHKGGENAYNQLNDQAATIAPGSQGVVVLPYFMGERAPVWDPDARGVIFGLSLSHTKAHLYRAFLEAVAFSLRHAMEATGSDLGKSILLAGGVTKSKLWKQIFADVTGYPIVCPKFNVEANMGDVILAGIGTGTLTYDDVKKWQILDEPVLPNAENKAIYDQVYKTYRSLYDDLKGTMHHVSHL